MINNHQNINKSNYNDKSFNYIFDTQLQPPKNRNIPIFDNYPVQTRLNNSNQVNNRLNKKVYIENYNSLPKTTCTPFNQNTPDLSLFIPKSTRTTDIKDKC
jgi:hypothetical protein